MKTATQKSLNYFPLFLAFYELMAYLSNDAYLPALPDIANALHAPQHLVQLTLSAWFLGLAALQLLLAPAQDVFGRRRSLLIGFILFLATSLGCAFVSNIYIMLFLRFFQGASISTLIVSGYATIHDIFDSKPAMHALALLSSITILAPSLGPLFGAVIIKFSNWRWVFIILSIGAVIANIGIFYSMPETATDKKIDLPNMFKQYKNIILNKQFLFLTFISNFLFSVMIMWITLGPFLLIDKFYFSELEYGAIQLLVFGCFIIGTKLVKPLLNKYEKSSIVFWGVAIALCSGVYGFFTTVFFSNTVWNIIIMMTGMTFSAGLILPILRRLAIEACTENMGLRVAMSSTLFCAFGVFGSLISSYLDTESLVAIATTGLTLSVLSLVFGRLASIKKAF